MIFGHSFRFLVIDRASRSRFWLCKKKSMHTPELPTHCYWDQYAGQPSQPAGPSCQEEILLNQVRHFWALFPRGHAKINWSDLFMAFIKIVVYLWAQWCNGQCRVSLALYENDRSEWVSHIYTIRNRSFSID